MWRRVSAGALCACRRRSGLAPLDAPSRLTLATVTIADVLQSNGVIHVVDKVLLPKQPPAHAW